MAVGGECGGRADTPRCHRPTVPERHPSASYRLRCRVPRSVDARKVRRLSGLSDSSANHEELQPRQRSAQDLELILRNRDLEVIVFARLAPDEEIDRPTGVTYQTTSTSASHVAASAGCHASQRERFGMN